MSESLPEIIKKLQDRVYSQSEIISKLNFILDKYFPFSFYYILSVDPNITFPTPDAPVISDQEKEWVMQRTKTFLLNNKKNDSSLFYLENRHTASFITPEQLEKEKEFFDYSCDDALYYSLLSDESTLLGIVFMSNWKCKERLDAHSNFDQTLIDLNSLMQAVTISLDNYYIHKKIENLLTDKQQLKQRIQKDEEDLKRRILELTVLYDTSNALGYSLDYYQIVSLIMDSLNKVLNFDICTILLLDLIPNGEMISRINSPINDPILKSVQDNTLSSVLPFIKRPIDDSSIKYTLEKRFFSDKTPISDPLTSFANVPLIFKEDIIGVLNICSGVKSAFPRNEMTFLHTMANQLSSHLGRLKIIKKLEKTKINSLIKSMTEGVIMLDENEQLEIINPKGMEFLNLPKKTVTNDRFKKLYKKIGLDAIHNNAKGSSSTTYTEDLHIFNKVFSVSVSPVRDADNNWLGTVFVIRDVTEIQRSNRIKAQRLDVIAKVNLIIKSISDLDNLLTVLMEFILNIADAEMGSIQLRRGRNFITKVHSNFPDKIRREYQFKSGETISEFVASTKDICFIPDYMNNPKFNQKTKIHIDAYICIPILVKHNLVGIIHIVRKTGNVSPSITSDDLETLFTITSLSGTAIENALLYQETLKKRQLDQELKIAHDIQTKLLPEMLPDIPRINFGAISIPAHEIGGDYYDFFHLKNGHIGIVIADIVGKGIPAGLFMGMLKSILHTHILALNSPKEALTRINSILFHDPVIDKFMPLFYGVLDPENLVFTYSNAGHEPGILIQENKTLQLDTDGFPLGGFVDTTYEEKQIHLNNHDVLLLFTDGIIEARDHKGVPLGCDHLISLAHQKKTANASDIANYIYSETTKKTIVQHDDLTLLTLKVDYTKRANHVTTPFKIKEIRVTSSKKYIKRIRQEVDSLTTRMGFEPADIFNLKLAINEAHANVIEHAYYGNENGDIIFTFNQYHDRLEVIIKDFGPGISSKSIKGAPHLEELEGSGLGVFLIKTVMDKVEYNRTARVGTELLMTKYIKGGKHGNP